LPQAQKAKLDQYDAELVQEIKGGDEARFKGTLSELLHWVRSSGTKVADADIQSSDVVLPSEDMSLKEAQDLMAQNGMLTG
jgi:hypothetical protein